MKVHKIKYLFTVAILMFISCNIYAQRINHGSRGGGGGSRQPANRGTINGGAQRSQARPATTQRPSTQQSKPKTQNRDYNNARPATRPSPSNQKPGNTPTTRPSGNQGVNKPSQGGNKPGQGVKPGQGGNKPGHGHVNKPPHHHKKSVNVNVRVHHGSHHRYYNGHRGYRPYHYHPYRPYYWGPRWHPYGFFLATMYTTAVIVHYNSIPYYYDSGVYYVEASEGYETVEPPINITITSLPDGVEKIEYNDITYYYFGGTFYEKVSDGFKVIEAPDGAIVTNIPEGGEEVEIESVKYVVFNDIYFQPLSQDGADLYQVVLMEPL